MSLRARVVIAIATAVVLFPAGANGGTPVTEGGAAPNEADPVLLMFHAGGFVAGSPDLLDEAAALARARGFRTVQVRYTLGDGTQALRDARSMARRWSRSRDVLAYGESAGGTLACRLAESGLVSAAGCMSPVADVISWARRTQPDRELRHLILGTRSDQLKLGLIGHPTAAPILAELGRTDIPVIARGIERWAASDPGVGLLRVPGGHLGDGGSYEDNVRELLRWLARQS